MNNLVRYFNADQTPSVRGLEYFNGLERRIAAAEAKLAAIAAIADPAGGATIDSQARTAIIAIIDGAT
jgi:hypothetical protein